jgi:signal transduction histidine kinase
MLSRHLYHLSSTLTQKAALLFLVLFFVFGDYLFCQSNGELGFPLIDNYSPKTYKGHGQVWAVIQDDRGLMYFGTSAGIVEYDGVNWNRVSISDSIVFQTVRAFEKADGGRIYFGGGLNFGYLEPDDYGNLKVTSMVGLVKPEFRDFSDTRSIRLLGDYLYVQTLEYIFRFNTKKLGEGGEFKAWKADSFFPYSMVIDNELYAFQLERGLFRLSGDSLQFVPGSEIFKNTRIYIMLPYNGKKDFQYLVGTSSEGFFGYNGQTFEKFETELDPHLSDLFLYRAITLPDRNYLVSLIGKGVYVMNPEGKILRNINYESGLQDESVYWPYLDQSGTLWMGLDNGISKAELSPTITTFSKQSGLKTGILSIQRANGRLVIGTPTGLSALNKATGKFEQIDFGGGTQVFDMLPIGDELIFRNIGGLGILDKNLKPAYELVDNRLSGMVFLRSKHLNQRVLVGGAFGVAVIKRNPSTKRWEKEGYFPGNFFGVWTMAETSQGDIWAGTQSGYAYKITPALDQNGNIDFEKSKIVTFGGEGQEKAGDGVIYGVAGKIFALSEKGLFSYNPNSGKFEVDNTFGQIKIDYASTDNFNLKEDTFGRVWITIKNNIRLATPLPNGGYKLEDDLFNGYPWEDITTIFPEDSATVWIGSGDGLVRMEIQKERSKGRPFRVLVRQAITKKDTLKLTVGDKIELENNNNSLRFMYAAPFYEQEERTLYQTYLEGFDADWTDWGNNSYKEYTNLGSGTYTFRVRAKNLYNNVSEEAFFSFTILPPWYGTWWAFLLYFLLFCVMVYVIDRFQRSRLLQREQEKVRQREVEHAREIQKAYNDLKNTQEQLIQSEKMASLGELTAGIAHEIQNPLNFVNNFSEVSEELIEEMNEEIGQGNYEEVKAISEDLKENLSKIKFHGKRADGIVKSMLQHSRKESGKKELTDINQVADEYLRLSYHGLRAKDKSFFADFHLDADPELPKVEVIPQEIGRVLLNLINNAFYAASEKKKLLEESGNLGDFKPKVWVITKNVANGVTISIRDNGNGIPEEIKSKIFQPFFTTKPAGSGTGLGLSMSYDIITKGHQGKLEVQSKTGESTEFTIFLNTKKL